MSVERHNIYEVDVGAYLLRSLSEVEEQRFEAHLEECPVCQDEVDRLRPAVNALPRSVIPIAPPASLKSGLMAAVEADLRELEPAPARPGPLKRLRASLARPGSSFGGLRPTASWVAASVVLLIGVASGAAGLYALTEATSEEDSSRSLIAKVDKTRVPFGSGSLVVPDRPQDGAVLRVHGMPELEANSVYQVWVRRGGEVISQSLFHVGTDGEGAGAVTGDLKGADSVMITREAAGGAKAPSEKPVLTVAL